MAMTIFAEWTPDAVVWDRDMRQKWQAVRIRKPDGSVAFAQWAEFDDGIPPRYVLKNNAWTCDGENAGGNGDHVAWTGLGGSNPWEEDW